MKLDISGYNRVIEYGVSGADLLGGVTVPLRDVGVTVGDITSIVGNGAELGLLELVSGDLNVGDRSVIVLEGVWCNVGDSGSVFLMGVFLLVGTSCLELECSHSYTLSL
jgi:hypothetical protein